jgi:signal transduction histidine kinase
VTTIALLGLGLVVMLVLLAGYLGYRGSVEIQDTAQELIQQDKGLGKRGAQLESKIVRQTEELLDGLEIVLGLCFLMAAGTAGLTAWTLQKAFAQLEWQTSELAHVSWHMIDAHEKMARRFSHEMHDELGQSLSGLRRLLQRPGEKELAAAREECVEIVDEVLESVRKLSQALRPVILDDFGLDSGLRWLCERFTQRTQIEVEYKSNLDERLAEGLETHLFRIAQEALTNIARHSGATRAWVDVRVEGGRIRLAIADDGKGLAEGREQETGASLGMVGMRARARQVNGELAVENRREGGLRIQATAPLVRAEASVEQENPSLVG